MNWKKFWWAFPLAAVVAVYLGYALFPLHALTPEISREIAVASGVRPASTVFPGLWRYFSNVLPQNAAGFAFFGQICAALFAFLFYQTLYRALLLIHRNSVDTDRLEQFFIPLIALVSTVMGCFAEPIWRAFSLFAPAALAMLFVAAISCLYLEWIEKGGVWRLGFGIFLMGVFTADTPLALLFPIAWMVIYFLLWRAIHGQSFHAREDLPSFRDLPKWFMFLSFASGLLIGSGAILYFVFSHDIATTMGWQFSYALFHYWEEYLMLFKTASIPAGWVLGLPLCVIPFIVVSRLAPILTDDDRPMPFVMSVAVLVWGIVAYFQQGSLRGAWFWTWVENNEHSMSLTLLGFFSILSTCTFALASLIFIADAFNSRRSDFREHSEVVAYRIAMMGMLALVSLLVVFRLPHSNIRKILEFNDLAIKETVRELNGAEYLFTDGSADAELELEAARQGHRLYTINLMRDSSRDAEALRLRGLTDDGDIIAAKTGASALLRTWACDKPDGLDNVGLQLGFELWKREKTLTPPVASAFVARTKGLREDDVNNASAIANDFTDRIAALKTIASAVDVPASVREVFFTVAWRLSRFARYRKDAELANRLDSMNTSLKRMLNDLEYMRLKVFLQMTPKEGLELALRRADFQDAARYAAAVLKVDEEDPKGNFAMGMYFLMANRMKDAETYLRRVLIKRPKEPAVLNNLSIICRKTHRYDEAVSLAKQALELIPDNEDVKETLRDAEAKVP